MAPEDYERVDFLERVATELDMHIKLAQAPRGRETRFEITIGRVTVEGPTLRAAIDTAMEAIL